MNDKKAFRSGATAGALLMIAAQGGHWMITPMNHPEASTFTRYAVVAQVVLCLGASLWLTWRQQKASPPNG